MPTPPTAGNIAKNRTPSGSPYKGGERTLPDPPFEGRQRTPPNSPYEEGERTHPVPPYKGREYEKYVLEIEA